MMIITRGMPAVQAMAHIEQEITDWRAPHLCQSFTLAIMHSRTWGPSQRLVDNRCGTEAIVVVSSTCERGCMTRAMLCDYHLEDLKSAFKAKSLWCPRCTQTAPGPSAFGELTYAELRRDHAGPRYTTSADYENMARKAREAAGKWQEMKDAARRMDEALHMPPRYYPPMYSEDEQAPLRSDGGPSQETIDEFVTRFFNGEWNGGYGRRGGG